MTPTASEIVAVDIESMRHLAYYWKATNKNLFTILNQVADEIASLRARAEKAEADLLAERVTCEQLRRESADYANRLDDTRLKWGEAEARAERLAKVANLVQEDECFVGEPEDASNLDRRLEEAWESVFENGDLKGGAA